MTGEVWDIGLAGRGPLIEGGDSRIKVDKGKGQGVNGVVVLHRSSCV